MDNDQVIPSLGDAVGSVVDQIMDKARTPEPEPEIKEVETEEPTPPEPKEVPEPEPPKETPKEKIKWQGQEIEMPLDEIKNLAQQGYDYTRKMQELKASVAPLEGLKKHIDDDPAFAAHIATYFKGKPEAREAPPKFDDPIDELEYRIADKVVKQVEEKFVKPIQQQTQQMTRQQVIASVRQQAMSDPQYHDIQKSMIEYVQALPEPLQKTAYLQLDQDPDAYVKTFNHFKSKMSTKQETKPEMPKATQRVERAPIVEAAGTAHADTASVNERRQKLARLKTKSINTGDPQALADWLLAGGAIDNILK